MILTTWKSFSKEVGTNKRQFSSNFRRSIRKNEILLFCPRIRFFWGYNHLSFGKTNRVSLNCPSLNEAKMKRNCSSVKLLCTTSNRKQGIVKFLLFGYGYIQETQNNQITFFQKKDMLDKINVGDRVEFSTEEPINAGFEAIHVAKNIRNLTSTLKWNEYITKLNSYREKFRDDPNFSLLCDIEKLNQRTNDKIFIPHIISLPQLPGISPPKGFENSSRKFFLVSENRYKTLKEIEDFIEGNHVIESNFGFILSGPNGVGKSAEGLLIASYAFMNRHILIYIPKCCEWFSSTESVMAVRFMECFIELNADLAQFIPSKRLNQSLLDLALYTTPKTAIDDMEELLDTLNEQVKFGVFYIFDDYKEINRESNSFLHNPEFLKRFTGWTRPTLGKRTVTIFTGSVNSEFESNLHVEGKWKVKHLQPFKQNEIELFISSPTSELSLPGSFFKRNDGKIDQLKMDKINFYTGFFLREIMMLKKENGFLKFEAQKFAQLKESLNLNQKISNNWIHFNQFLLQIFTRFHRNSVDEESIRDFCSGDFFYKSDGGYMCVSGLVRNFLKPSLANALKENLKPISSYPNSVEQDIALEQWNVFKLIVGQIVTLECFIFDLKKTEINQS
jgi:hypothetical protein